MSAFLTDTLVWTGALIALVLLARRPVAAIFGPRAAYALWALPMARLLLPPLVLPAWMAPAAPMTEPARETAALAVLAESAPGIAAAPAEPAPSLLASLAAFDWAGVLLPIWLAGAALFLIRRYALYFEMRRELLAEARPMGEAGRVRLVETPAADGPVAFGVLDKVVALPPGFMSTRDRAARDLALAHELAHHRGHDLACNMLVQPLFALHWFNPLATLGWRALRRDQEAACDARVIAYCPRESRAAYATVIARFATRPRDRTRLALAAPMACPVLGDRSIVQRLKGLTMTEISARRRWSVRLLIAAAALALPLTGSISYAQEEGARAPVSPPAPPAPPAVLAPPAPPAAPAVLAPPAPPAAPEALGDDRKLRIMRIERREGAGESERAGKDKKRRVERLVIVRGGQEPSAEERAEFEKEMKELRKELGEHGELRRELERELGANSEFQKEMRETFGKDGEFHREMRLVVADARAAARVGVQAAARAPRVAVRCREGQRDVAETVVAGDGRQQIFVCNSLATAEARRAIALARAEIARTRELTERERAEALRSLDEAERKNRAD